MRVLLKARLSAAPVPIKEYFRMKLRGSPARDIIEGYIEARKANLPVTWQQIEVHHLAGGDFRTAVKAAVSARKVGLNPDWKVICAMDLALRGSGLTVMDAVQGAITPRTLDIPGGSGWISAVAQDGQVVKVRAAATVRYAINRVVGGTGEDTFRARIAEAVVSLVGQAKTRQEVVQRPSAISSGILRLGLDSGTRFEWLGFDIKSVE